MQLDQTPYREEADRFSGSRQEKGAPTYEEKTYWKQDSEPAVGGVSGAGTDARRPGPRPRGGDLPVDLDAIELPADYKLYYEDPIEEADLLNPGTQAVITDPTHMNSNSDTDHDCDYCGEIITPCEDSGDDDALCDVCGENLFYVDVGQEGTLYW